MRNKTYLIALVVIAGSAACQTMRPIAADEVTPARFIYDGWRLGTTTDEIRNHLGAPMHLRVREVPNRHAPEQIDEIRQLEYDGLILTIYKVNDEARRELPISIAVTNPRFAIGWGLNVGTTKEEVRRVLGKASETPNCESSRRNGNQIAHPLTGDCGWQYSDGEAGSEVIFWFEDDRVYRIDWSFYVD